MFTPLPSPAAYVLITPARDEVQHIGKTLDSMVAQSVRPLRWVIVSDGSTDGTDDVVREYAAKHEWIELVALPPRTERHFAGKVHAFNAGWERVKDLPWEIIGNLDGDVSFGPDYMEYLLGKFARYPHLGVAGTNYLDDAADGALRFDYRYVNPEDVSGICQLFRRDCYLAIGGYRPSKHGGVDLFATLSARMHGWSTRSFTGRHCIHHRPQGTASTSRLMVRFHWGRKDYLFGNHPFWELFRASYQVTRRPYVLGGVLLMAGYLWALLTRAERTVGQDVMRFRRREQLGRLRRLAHNVFSRLGLALIKAVFWGFRGVGDPC